MFKFTSDVSLHFFSLKMGIGYPKARKCILSIFAMLFFALVLALLKKNFQKLKSSMKKLIFLKTGINSKTKMKCKKKNSLYKCRANNSSWIDMNIDSVCECVEPFARGTIYRGPLFFPFFGITCFLWRKREKLHDRYPVIFWFYMCLQIFITIGPTIKKKDWDYSPLKKSNSHFKNKSWWKHRNRLCTPMKSRQTWQESFCRA